MQRLMGCDDKGENPIKHFMKPTNVTKAYLQVKREEYIKKSGAIPLEGKHYLLMEGDFTEVAKNIAPNSIDAIIVDPPYDKESIKTIIMAICELALVVLKPNGNLLMMVWAGPPSRILRNDVEIRRSRVEIPLALYVGMAQGEGRHGS